MTTLIESNEHKSLREAVAAFAKTHPHTLNAEDNTLGALNLYSAAVRAFPADDIDAAAHDRDTGEVARR